MFNHLCPAVTLNTISLKKKKTIAIESKHFPEKKKKRSFLISYGPIITIYTGFNPAIFVANHSLSHKALIQNSAVFADRPTPPPTAVIVSSNKHNINSASYGPTWRLFRRNFTPEILHPSHMKSYSHARKWVLDILLNRLRSNTE